MRRVTRILVALCQFLPGPASSQVGFALGLLRGGLLGAVAAWAAFTLPSAAALVLFARGAEGLEGTVGGGLVHGLKVVAVAVVAQAVWGMARTFASDRERAAIAVSALLLVTLTGSSVAQVVAIAAGALAGLRLCRNGPVPNVGQLVFPVTRRAGAASLALFLVLLVLLPVVSSAVASQGLAVFAAFYRVGSLVFGGGHVVLPLLQAEVLRSGWMGRDTFVAGYGAAQAVPGPLFSFAAYLGAEMQLAPNGIAGAAIALIAIFLPGFLLLLGVLPFWDELRTRTNAQAAMRGANAAVVGVLGAALYRLVWTSAIFGLADFALALPGFVLLTVWKVPPWMVVGLLGLGGVILNSLGAP